jgi:hypothetical protein
MRPYVTGDSDYMGKIFQSLSDLAVLKEIVDLAGWRRWWFLPSAIPRRSTQGHSPEIGHVPA